MDLGETIGKGIGVLLAPLAALSSFGRGTRLFHADGAVYRAEVRADVTDGALGALAHRLAGPAIVRVSAGAVPGVAVRFGTAPVAAPAPGTLVQDLILLSVRSLLQLPIAAWLTDARGFLANTYFAIGQARAAGLGLVELRLVPAALRAAGGAPAGVEEDRFARLDRRVAEGTAALRLELKRIEPTAPWQDVATMTLTGRADLDQEALGFNPYRARLGLEPAGFLQGLRWAVYPASQLGRDLRHRLAAWWARMSGAPAAR